MTVDGPCARGVCVSESLLGTRTTGCDEGAAVLEMSGVWAVRVGGHAMRHVGPNVVDGAAWCRQGRGASSSSGGRTWTGRYARIGAASRKCYIARAAARGAAEHFSSETPHSRASTSTRLVQNGLVYPGRFANKLVKNARTGSGYRGPRHRDVRGVA